jgi:hypothetical protein
VVFEWREVKLGKFGGCRDLSGNADNILVVLRDFGDLSNVNIIN